MRLAASTFFATANYVEAALWTVIGGGFLVHALVRPRGRPASIAAAATFLAFGLSDVVEVRTGAWWRPWWLLAWKGGCVLVFLWLVAGYLRGRRGRGGHVTPGTAPR
jgi:hypothetical protein